ncbi:hypothetical protein [Streptomyces bohaiensis]|uniref:Uncharacterized protein n=1 Tax=Streptomyces bohaiensis TaxID=1431344 RepID=A0ABX1C8M9_9ACTN|nr:hypothetical protein [Streptomyces bohaiensis]NJQ13464.1 hypothetical protein [Streptomyces bohaiensis]
MSPHDYMVEGERLLLEALERLQQQEWAGAAATAQVAVAFSQAALARDQVVPVPIEVPEAERLDLPVWCGQCISPKSRLIEKAGGDYVMRCPDCHPMMVEVLEDEGEAAVQVR